MEGNNGEQTLVDRDGEVRLELRDGIWWPKLSSGRNAADNIIELPNFKLREDDILITAYPKSGTHWIHEIIGMLQNKEAKPLEQEKEFSMIDFHGFEFLDSLPSPRILNTHYWAQHIPIYLMKKCKQFHIMRNPKDVAVSTYCHVKTMLGESDPNNPLQTFRTGYQMFMDATVMYGSWFEYERQYEQVFNENTDLDSINLCYEDMIKNPLGTIKKVAAHLKRSYDDEFLLKVIDACHIDKMREYVKTRSADVDWLPQFIKEGGLYRKGKIGDWKNWFTVAENETFDKIYKERMEGSDLQFQYE